MNNERVLASVAIGANAASAAFEICTSRKGCKQTALVLGDRKLYLVLLIVPEAGLTRVVPLADDSKQSDNVTRRSRKGKAEAPRRGALKSEHLRISS
jgi:hypothetical protein